MVSKSDHAGRRNWFWKGKRQQKEHLKPGDKIVLLGGDNYRIGMGGGAVSSVATGEYANAIELNAIQRSNPEMQKRVMNAIRAMAGISSKSDHFHSRSRRWRTSSIVFPNYWRKPEVPSILIKLPIGDPTLSDKEIISNESQERMGLAIQSGSLETLQKVSERERAPFYVVGEATGDHKLDFSKTRSGEKAR